MHNCRSKLFYFSCFIQPFRAFDIQSMEMQVKLSIYRLTCKNETFFSVTYDVTFDRTIQHWRSFKACACQVKL